MINFLILQITYKVSKILSMTTNLFNGKEIFKDLDKLKLAISGKFLVSLGGYCPVHGF